MLNFLFSKCSIPSDKFFFWCIQELTLRMEKMTDGAAKKKRELEHELTLTMTAQVSYLSNKHFMLSINRFWLP